MHIRPFLFASACATLSLLAPFSCLAAEPDMQLVNGSVDTLTLKTGDILFLGAADDSVAFDSRWQILDPNAANTGEPGLFLMSEHLVAPEGETGILFNDVEEPEDNEYRGTTLHLFIQELEQNLLRPAETEAVVQTYKSDDAWTTRTAMGDREVTVGFDPAPNILQGDRFFPLSAEEVNQESYGFETDADRVASCRGEDSNWWLRSPHDDSFPIDVGFVFSSGWQADLYVNGFEMLHTPYTTRLAMNLDPARILFVTAADSMLSEEAVGGLSDVPESEVSEWKLTLLDDSQSAFSVSKKFKFFNTCWVRYSGLDTENESRISAVIVREDGTIRAYGAFETPETESGTFRFSTKNLLRDGETLYLFSEQVAEGTEPNLAGALQLLKW